jgi:hypothetical protein
MNRIKLIMDMVEILFKSAIIGDINASTVDIDKNTHVHINFTIKKLKSKRSVAE